MVMAVVTKPVQKTLKSAYAEGGPRIPTGIPGLDDMMEGGFEKGSVNIVAGESGTGKSILSLQYLYNGAIKHGHTCLYITFEEKKDQIKEHMRRFGMNFDELEERKKMFIYEYSPQEVDRFINDGGTIEKVIRNNGVDRLVLDSITSYAVLFENEQKRRAAIVKLLDTIRKWGCTTVLPSESSTISALGEVRAKFSIEYLADALLAIYSIRKGDVREMALEVLKMRGTAHSKKLAPMKITREGIVLYPDQPFFAKQF
jgi:circadian clock protein KaiC